MEIVLIPIHTHDHWTVVVIDNWLGTISHYDSYYNDDRQKVCQKILNYMLDEHWDKKGSALKKRYRFDPHASRERQQNNYDCGVYVCKVGRSFLDHAWRHLTSDEIRTAILGEVTQVEMTREGEKFK